jgi:uncharacterized membrane protein YeiH
VLQVILNYAGIAVFACSGATVGMQKGFDWFGIATLGVVTGVGGGVLRDVLLDISPQSIQRWPNITVALIAVALVILFAKVISRINRSVLVLDAVGMGFFSSSGGAIAVDAGASWFAASLAGMLTAIAGGMLRDVLAREVPSVMGRDDLYAIPSIVGALTYVAIDHFGPQWLGVAVGAAAATSMRLMALAFHWKLPTGSAEAPPGRKSLAPDDVAGDGEDPLAASVKASLNDNDNSRSAVRIRRWRARGAAAKSHPRPVANAASTE